MRIFLRALPVGTRDRDLKAFVQTVITPPWYMPLRNRAIVKSCKILKIVDPKLGTVEFHGLLDVQPVKAALAAIERLNGHSFKGYRLEARKWHVRRKYYDDRRNLYTTSAGAWTNERRQGDRRRSTLMIEIYPEPRVRQSGFEGVRGLHRHYGMT